MLRCANRLPHGLDFPAFSSRNDKVLLTIARDARPSDDETREILPRFERASIQKEPSRQVVFLAHCADGVPRRGSENAIDAEVYDVNAIFRDAEKLAEVFGSGFAVCEQPSCALGAAGDREPVVYRAIAGGPGWISDEPQVVDRQERVPKERKVPDVGGVMNEIGSEAFRFIHDAELLEPDALAVIADGTADERLGRYVLE